jgi:hypothetical protein
MTLADAQREAGILTQHEQETILRMELPLRDGTDAIEED